MKKSLKITISAAAALIILALVWRLWPHDLAHVISSGENEISSIACTASFGGVENGKTYIDTYKLQSLSKGSQEFSQVLGVLQSSKYRQNFQNLFPWDITSVDSDGGSTLLVSLAWGDGYEDSCYLVFHESGQVTVNRGSDSGFKIYQAANSGVFETLANFVRDQDQTV